MGRILWSKRFDQLLQTKRLAIFEACLIGLVSGLAAVLLKQGVGWLGGWRIAISHQLPPLFVIPTFGLLCGLLAGFLVEKIAPETSGSGIPQVKAVLNRVPIPLNLRVALVKLVGGILSLGSGLPLGREGPTVQVGAALASVLSRWVPTSSDYRRQLIAAGAGAGLAAAFNAPIAGVLFVVEELLQDVSDLTLGTAILASFIGAVVSRQLGGHGLDVNLDVTTPPTTFFMQEIPFYLILGILAGGFGALFNRGIIASMTFNRDILSRSLPLRVGMAGLISGLAIALLPTTFHDNAGLREILVTGGATWQMAGVAFVAYFILTLISYGSGAPGGLFAPTLILGSALGYLIGIWEYHWLGETLPTTYALAGMGTFFSGVARVPITSIVIVFEMTRDFNLVLPLMIGCVVAYLVGNKLAEGSIYDILLEWNGIHLEEETPQNSPLSLLTATDVMQRRVETLSSQMTLEEAVEAFSRSHHRGFPVIQEGKLVGILTQGDIASTTQRQLTGDILISQIMTPQPVTVAPNDRLTRVLHLITRHNISRLPVTEGRKLLGIITRSDIIRAESDYFKGETALVGPRPEPSYVVYQTRSPAVGNGRLLVPLANPHTLPLLLKLAGAIASDRSLELECLHVIVVPRHTAPSETKVDTAISDDLLRQARRFCEKEQIPVHTQVRVAHDIAQAILETIQERHMDLVLMGWKGSTTTPGRVFGSIYDTVIRQAACEVVLVKLGETLRNRNSKPGKQSNLIPANLQTLNRWLVPMAGGPNAQEAVRLLPALVSLSQEAEVRLCQVFPKSDKDFDTTALDETAESLRRNLNAEVITIPVCASSLPEAIIDLAQKDQCDVIVLGASRERLLQQVIKGNIPEEIVRQSNCTVMLVRGATG